MQKKIYTELLEQKIIDLEQQVEEMKAELVSMAKLLVDNRIPTLSECSKCGIQITPDIKQFCLDLKCPSGLGPVYYRY